MIGLFLFLISCNTPQSDVDCIVYYDKCNSGCEALCGTEADERKAERGGVCDLGCMDTGEPPACILVDGECAFAD